MRKFLISLLFTSLMFAGSGVKQGRYVPGEIIIKYERYGQNARGSEILTEYQNFVDILKLNMKGINIKSYFPVFGSIIKEMTDKNLTEEELINNKTFNKKYKSTFSLVKRTSFSNILLLKMNQSVGDMEELAASIIKNSNVLESQGIRIIYAEPNYLKRTSTGGNDPLYSQQWSGKITNIEKAWDTTQGSPNIKIAIIDTGVDPTHPDLTANLLPGYDFVDIDTSYYKTFNYYGLLPGEDYTQPDNDCTDYNGHGTHCAGIAAAVGDNEIGIKGVAPNCKILPIRAGFSILVNGQEIGALETTSIVNAINYAIDKGANVISMSFGGTRSELEEEAIQYAYYRNVVLIAAAGNSSSTEKEYPAGYDEVLAVTSVDSTRTRSSFSNYGAWTAIAAPGDNIISTVPTTGGDISDASGYKRLSGTSMAAPYVAGIAALLLSRDSSLSNNIVYQTLRTSVNSNYTSDFYLGTGIIDAYKAVSRNEACISKITAPHNINSIYISQGDIAISGRASGAFFSKYSFEYSDYQNSKPVWQTLGQTYTTPVDSGYLGNVNIAQNGIYYIRLKVTSSKNVDYTDVIGPIIFDKRMKANWPVPINTGNVSSPAVADIDKDGNTETIFSSSDGKVYVVDQNGINKPGWPVILPETTAFKAVAGFSSPSVADIDNDGKDEIVLRDGNHLYVYGYDGKAKSGWPRITGTGVYGNGLIGSPVIADIDNDGEKEILLTYPENNCDADKDGALIAFKSNGDIMPGWPVKIKLNTTFATLFSTPVVSDLDGDGNVEIILQCLDDILLKGYLYVFDKNGNILPGWPQEIGNGSYASPIAVDINNDGQNEIVASSFISGGASNGKLGIYVFNKVGELLNGWPAVLNDGQYGYYNIRAGISAGDINNDGYKEIIVGSSGYNYVLWALDKNGKLIWSLPNQTFEYVQSSIPLIADINGDGNPEILISKYRIDNSFGRIITVSNTGQILPDQTFAIPEMIGATPSIGDIDGDNQLELICASQKGNVFCWDINVKNDSSKIIWPTFQLNNQRNGSIDLSKTVPLVTQLVEPLNNAANQPGKITFKWDPVQGALKYRFQLSDSSSFNNIVFEDTSVSEVYCLVDSVQNNSNGLKKATKYYWRVSAKNLTGESTFSEVWNFTTLIDAPDSLVASMIGKWKIKLVWKNISGNIAGFKIERKLSDNYALVDSVNYGVTSYIDTSLTTPGTYHYRVYAYTFNAQSPYSNESSALLTGINDNSIPIKYIISQNYPNPFNPTTVIEYGLPVQSQVKIVVFNILGEVVKELTNTIQSAGYHSVNFGGTSLSSGIYFYKIEAKAVDGSKQFREIKKMILLK